MQLAYQFICATFLTKNFRFEFPNQSTTYFRHSNVIGYKEAFFDEQSSTLCIVMEFADGGDLYQKILEN
jgi:serine/threonine protein kinase